MECCDYVYLCKLEILNLIESHSLLRYVELLLAQIHTLHNFIDVEVSEISQYAQRLGISWSSCYHCARVYKSDDDSRLWVLFVFFPHILEIYFHLTSLKPFVPLIN